MRYRLRTLLVALAVGPVVIAGCYFGLQQVQAPAWAVPLGTAQVVFWIAVLAYILRPVPLLGEANGVCRCRLAQQWDPAHSGSCCRSRAESCPAGPGNHGSESRRRARRLRRLTTAAPVITCFPVSGKVGSMAHQEFQSCIAACVECAQECEHCADACLGERDVAKMAECIRLDRDCAQACWGAAAFMSRGSRFAQELCRVCAEICEACGAECRRHKQDHCQRCADACERCAEECRRMAGVAA